MTPIEERSLIDNVDHTIPEYQQAIEIELDEIEELARRARTANCKNFSILVDYAAQMRDHTIKLKLYSKSIQDKLSQENQSST